MLPRDVKKSLSKHILADGLDIVVDLENSKGSWLVDKISGNRYLDFFSMFASMSVGFNHPKLLAVQEQFGKIAIQKPSNSDAYTITMAEFVDTFSQFGIPRELPYAFFIDGGALAVENALKTAFDWKVRKNFSRGHEKPVGSKIIHFQQAFHGRTGYTMSLTNTSDLRKTQYFPTFDWPRIINPKLFFPLSSKNIEATIRNEKKALAQIRQAIDTCGEEIAGLIIEPIQGEGGDNHFRKEFMISLRKICDENEILFILDEVQTGIGLTGTFWAYEQMDIIPDIICFGKKSQVCGILVSRRIDEVEHHVFKESSRINSTFGGNLIDMLRFTHILKIIQAENLIKNARIQGEFLLSEITGIANTYPDIVSNPRGLGLMCAFDLPDTSKRNAFKKRLFDEKFLVLACGNQGIRFRPHLTVTRDEIQTGIDIIHNVLASEGKQFVHSTRSGNGS
ncbi:MAG: L-lysine 6-transaminase [Desulfobacteraceae bacterium]|nr:MAG: L-lysine 6-transaminase [Desulfobacteraceae bacterium]